MTRCRLRGPCARTAVVTLVAVAVLGVVGRAQGRRVLTLAAAVHDALQRSPELQPRGDAVRSAAVQRRLVAAQFGLKLSPNFSTGASPGGYTTRQSGVTIGKRLTTGADTFFQVSSYSIGTGVTQRDTGYTIGISQPLLRGFARTATAELTAATRATESAARAFDVAREALIVGVTSRYFGVLKQQRMAAATEQAADRARSLRLASQARTRVGLATELDVLRAEVLEAQMQAAAGSAQTALAAAKDDLLLLIGTPVGEDIDVELPANVDTLARLDGPSDVSALVRSALDRRIEVREAHDRVGDAGRAVNVARWSQLPPLALDVSYTQRGIGSPLRDTLNAFAGGWRIGLGGNYAVDRAAEAAAGETAGIAMETATRDAETIEQRVAAEVRQLHRQWLTAGAAIEIQQKAVDLAQRQLHLAQLRYERGLGGSLEVVDAQTSVLQTENALIAAELDRAVYALDLKRAAGLLDIGSLGW